jgi:hypothetical protein
MATYYDKTHFVNSPKGHDLFDKHDLAAIGRPEPPDRDNWQTLGVVARKVLVRSARGSP